MDILEGYAPRLDTDPWKYSDVPSYYKQVQAALGSYTKVDIKVADDASGELASSVAPLFEALTACDLEKFQEILGHRPELINVKVSGKVNGKSLKEDTVLTAAVKYLWMNEEVMTAMVGHLLTAENTKDVIDVNAQGSNGDGALSSAAVRSTGLAGKSYITVLGMLLEHPGIDPNLPNNAGLSPLMRTACDSSPFNTSGELENFSSAVIRLADHPKTDINMKLSNESSSQNVLSAPIMLAARGASLGRREYLLLAQLLMNKLEKSPEKALGEGITGQEGITGISWTGKARQRPQLPTEIKASIR